MVEKELDSYAKHKFDAKRPTPEHEKELNDFVGRLGQIIYFRPDSDPKKEWRVFYADTWDAAAAMAKDAAGGDASLIDARAATSVRSLDAVWGSPLAAEENKRWAEAYSKAFHTIWYSNGESFANLAGGAAADAAALASALFTRENDYEGRDKTIAAAKERMEVWEKGYGLAAEKDGVLYVYAVGKPPQSAGMSVQLAKGDGTTKTFTDVKGVAVLERK